MKLLVVSRLSTYYCLLLFHSIITTAISNITEDSSTIPSIIGIQNKTTVEQLSLINTYEEKWQSYISIYHNSYFIVFEYLAERNPCLQSDKWIQIINNEIKSIEIALISMYYSSDNTLITKACANYAWDDPNKYETIDSLYTLLKEKLSDSTTTYSVNTMQFNTVDDAYYPSNIWLSNGITTVGWKIHCFVPGTQANEDDCGILFTETSDTWHFWLSEDMTEILGWMMVALLGCTCIMGILVSCLKDVQIKRIRRWRKRKSKRLLRSKSRKHGGAKYESVNISSPSADDSSDVNVNESILDQFDYGDDEDDDVVSRDERVRGNGGQAVADELKMDEDGSVAGIEEEEAVAGRNVVLDDVEVDDSNEGSVDMLEADFPVEGNMNRSGREINGRNRNYRNRSGL